MAPFDSIISSLRLQSFVSVLLPYLVTFLVIGGLIYYITGYISQIKNLNGYYRKATRLGIALILGGILSIFVSGALQMFVPI
ncbi:MAG: hypothetical protein BRC29_01550 [Nanohaloarchaea archaeon SW_7_43_1]|nr:MAG: hypothetical protein BRC29_01550 [Nanohaloarchaea archaeon SW_7_43_1]